MAWIQRPWGRMCYSDTGGSGAALVLLHGSGCDSSDWEDVVRALPRSLRIVRADFRGHGESDVPGTVFTIDDLATDVLSLMEHLDLRPVILVGHSLGGMVAMAAATRSSRIKSLVLLEAWTRLEASGAFEGDRHFGRLSPAAVDSINAKNRRTAARFAPAVWSGFWATAADFDATAFLRTTRIEIIEAYGDIGRTGTTRERLMIPDAPGIQVTWLHGAGHYLPHEEPRRVAELIQAAGR